MSEDVRLVNMFRQLVRTQIIRDGKTVEISIAPRQKTDIIKLSEYSPLVESQIRNGILKEQSEA